MTSSCVSGLLDSGRADRIACFGMTLMPLEPQTWIHATSYSEIRVLNCGSLEKLWGTP